MQRLWPANAPMRKTVRVFPRPFWREAGLSGQVMQVDGPVLWSGDASPQNGAVGVISAFIKPGTLPNDPKHTKSVLSAILAQALGEAGAASHTVP
jgi:monoamine oxidase